MPRKNASHSENILRSAADRSLSIPTIPKAAHLPFNPFEEPRPTKIPDGNPFSLLTDPRNETNQSYHFANDHPSTKSWRLQRRRRKTRIVDKTRDDDVELVAEGSESPDTNLRSAVTAQKKASDRGLPRSRLRSMAPVTLIYHDKKPFIFPQPIELQFGSISLPTKGQPAFLRASPTDSKPRYNTAMQLSSSQSRTSGLSIREIKRLKLKSRFFPLQGVDFAEEVAPISSFLAQGHAQDCWCCQLVVQSPIRLDSEDNSRLLSRRPTMRPAQVNSSETLQQDEQAFEMVDLDIDDCDNDWALLLPAWEQDFTEETWELIESMSQH